MGTGATRIWAGRSRRRWSGARSYSGRPGTVREVAANVEPYIRADGTKVWSLMQLERQLRPSKGVRSAAGGYIDPSTAPAADT